MSPHPDELRQAGGLTYGAIVRSHQSVYKGGLLNAGTAMEIDRDSPLTVQSKLRNCQMATEGSNLGYFTVLAIKCSCLVYYQLLVHLSRNFLNLIFY